jgi:hypothetical protein
MTDVAEERRLGMIDLGERLGALPLGLVRRGIAHDLRDAGREQVMKPGVGLGAAEQTAEARHDEPEGRSAAGPLDRQNHRAARCAGSIHERYDRVGALRPALRPA